MSIQIEESCYGELPSGDVVKAFVLRNSSGMVAKVIAYGAILTELHVPDRDGVVADVVLGFDDLDGYLAGHPYFGATVGRYGNRIGNATFSLEGNVYRLPVNDGSNSLHGGDVGFDKILWRAEKLEGKGFSAVRFHHRSPDGDQGYPGNLDTTVTYELNDQNELIIHYKAVTDAPTMVNLTHHSYFNLKGQGRGDILDHELRLNATHFTPVDSNQIPSGEIRSVKGTPMDFLRSTRVGERIGQDDEQLKFGRGYDHNWVINRDSVSGGPQLAAVLYEATSGREMTVLTNEPGIQFYTGNFLDGSLTGKGGCVYHRRNGLCLETQHFPDSPNCPNFPTTRLNPGEVFRSSTIHRFSAR